MEKITDEVTAFDATTSVAKPEDIAAECSALMDEIEAEGSAADSDDPRMVRIGELATYLSYFYPDLLDKRFG